MFKKYQDIKQRLKRRVRRSVIYVFITKMLLGLVLEFPYDLFVVRELNLIPLGINIAFHPFLLFLIGTQVKIPSEKNTLKIISEVKRITKGEKGKEILFNVKKPAGRSALNLLFKIFYGITFLVSFGILIWALLKLNFNLLSIIIFLFFLSVVSFFGVTIRQSVKEIKVLSPKESFFTLILDFLSIPILRVGRFISMKAPKFNIFIFVLDFVIEAPFMTLIKVFEDFTSFIKEKKRRDVLDKQITNNK